MVELHNVYAGTEPRNARHVATEKLRVPEYRHVSILW